MEIPPRGTRGAWVPWGGVLERILKPLVNGQIARYRKTAGPNPPVMMGFPVVLLTTVGAKTGHEHTSVLGGFQDGDDAWLVVASKSGASTHPHWFVNLARNPDKVRLEVGNRRLTVTPTVLKGKEREEALARIAAIAPRYGGYQKKTDREIPVIRLKAAA
ncbi:MAG TPA: nitroreductase/quinone reductase family protein [Candidatus Limnocylindrales bacterium]|nr:nitroreductase/quinone reductase family protein [Candidatus Limnocylindrales bacterium]